MSGSKRHQGETILDNHLERVRSRTLDKFTMDKIPQWIEKHTKKDGRHYSFKDHEYQARIVGDTTKELAIRKCSQIGMSESSSRMALALVGVIPYYTVIYTLPTSMFAINFMKTRIDPIVESSNFLSEIVDINLDNSEIKRFGDSYLYVKGCQSNNAPISVPADHLIHDEVDFSNPDVITQYQSRLTHSKYKRKTFLSTPTFPNLGIDAEFQISKKHFCMVKCNHCSQYFLPNYYDHVQIPGFTGDLREITKQNLGNIQWNKAQLHCPHCFKVPSLQIEHREWVCENPDSNFDRVGYQISPFDAPNIHMRDMDMPLTTASFLVKTSTVYTKRADFVNFALGLPAQDSDSTVTEDDVNRVIFKGEVTGEGSYVFGLDMGLTCHLTVGKVVDDGQIVVVHVEAIPATKIRQRRKELAMIYWPRVTVVDNLPYTETVMAMQKDDQNMFGAWYEDKKSLELFRVKDREEDEDGAKEQLRQVHINRNKAFDAVMQSLRSGEIHKKSCSEDDNWKAQLTDMKRGQEFDDKQGALTYVWKKSSKGNDHYHHSLLYCYIAARMVGVRGSTVPITKMFRTFKVRR